MFNSNSWKQLPKWSYLLAYHNEKYFKIMLSKSKLPFGMNKLQPWSQYNSILETLLATKLPVEELPKYVIMAKKFVRRGCVEKLEKAILDQIPYWDILYPHQKKAVAYAIQDYKGRVYLADEMGVGKSFSAITIVNYMMLKRPDVRKILIVCPASLRKNWTDIVTNKLVVQQSEVVILSYDKAKNLKKELKAKKFDLYLADEAHCLKDPKSQRYKKLAPILKKIEFRVLLSGTPTVNRANELYSPLSLLYPKLFKSYRKYNDRYFNVISRKCRLPAELSLMLPLFGFVRRLKTQVLALPEKKIKIHNINVPNASKDLNIMMKKMLLEENANNPNFLKYLIGEAFHKLGFIKSHNEIFKNMLQSLIQEEGEKGQQKVVFCFHKSMVECVQQLCESLDFSYMVINGETVPKKRGKIVEDFQNKRYKVIICSINAAGVGITLTSANHVILAECSWVPGLNQQAIDRVHRIGQEKTVYVDRIHCTNSIDDFITKCENSKSKMHLVLMRHAKANI